MKKFAIIGLACVIASSAWAGTSTLNYNPTGSSAMRVTSDTSNFFLNNVTIWDSAAGANGLAVNASGQLTISNSSFAATQGTAANLNATVVGTGLFTAQVNSMTSWAGGTLGAMANYGTSPGAVLVPGVNAFVTNANANGAAAAASSSPVTPSNQPVGSANYATSQVTVGVGAVQILAPRTGVSGTGRISATITNTTTTAIYLGGVTVTSSTGQLLPGIVGASVTLNTTSGIYGNAVSSATVTAVETF